MPTPFFVGTEIGTDGFFVFALNRNSDEWATESRMFCPAARIPEDRSAATRMPCGGLLVDLGHFGKNSNDFRPPSAMKRPDR